MRRKQGYAYYRVQHRSNVKVFKIIFIIFLFCTAIQVFEFFFIDLYSIKTVSMEPAIEKGDRIAVSPLVYGVKSPFTGNASDFISQPRRGDIVLVLSPHVTSSFWIFRYFDQYIRLFTFQKASIVYKSSNEWGSAFQVKRIVALPGETVHISNYEAFIRKENSVNFVSEKVLITNDYTFTPGVEGSDTAPLSSAMAAVTLDENEYFLLGDNRVNSLDSRTYGAVDRSRIVGKILFSF